MSKFDRNPDCVLRQSLFACGELRWPLYSTAFTGSEVAETSIRSSSTGWRRINWRRASYLFIYLSSGTLGASAVCVGKPTLPWAGGFGATIWFHA